MFKRVRKGVKFGIAAERKLRSAISKRKPLIKKALVRGSAAARKGYTKSKPYIKKAIKMGKPVAGHAIKIAKKGAARILSAPLKKKK